MLQDPKGAHILNEMEMDVAGLLKGDVSENISDLLQETPENIGNLALISIHHSATVFYNNQVAQLTGFLKSAKKALKEKVGRRKRQILGEQVGFAGGGTTESMSIFIV